MPLERSVKLHISAYIWLVLPCRMEKCTCSGLWVSGSISFARLHEIYGNLFVFIMSAFCLFLACFPFVKSRRWPLAISISYVISVFSFPLVSLFFFFFFFVQPYETAMLLRFAVLPISKRKIQGKNGKSGRQVKRQLVISIISSLTKLTGQNGSTESFLSCD